MKIFVFHICLVLFGSSLATAAGPCPPNFSGLVSNAQDCHSFYLCNDGNPSLIPCPLGLCFNPKNSVCDFCSSVPECGDDAVTTASPSSSSPPFSDSTTPSATTNNSTVTSQTFTTSSTTPATSPTTSEKSTTLESGGLPCPEEIPFIYMPYPDNCNKFYFCENGLNMGVYNCGVGLWFDFKGQVCGSPWGTSCNL